MSLSDLGTYRVLALSIVILAFLLHTGWSVDRSRQCVDADAVSPRATAELHKSLEELTHYSTFFSIFRVALDTKCPFWEDNGQCRIRECSVCNCAPHEVPTAWRVPKSGEGCVGRAPSPGNVDRTLPAFLKKHEKRMRGRYKRDDALVWTAQDSAKEAQFVDLRKNPEQFTGYTGAHANSIWAAVYNENCFTFSQGCKTGICAEDTCKEERVLYRLISGIHTSITAHLLKMYKFSDGRWGENAEGFRFRIGNHPERIKNLNVALAIATRATAKASKALSPENYKYVTGDSANDEFTRAQLRVVLSNPLLDPDCRKPAFDESDMFLAEQRYQLAEFRGKFHNISKIMNCLGCEKCRLWGKLQFLGLGTALRVLFERDVPKLNRNEVIALVNLLHKLSASSLWVRRMERRQRFGGASSSLRFAAGMGCAIFLFAVFASSSGQKKKATAEKKKER